MKSIAEFRQAYSEFNPITKYFQLKPIIFFCKTLILVLRDPRLPSFIKPLLWLGFIYLCSPLDLIEDVLPGGYLDDTIIVPLIILTAIALIPKRLLEDAKISTSRARLGLICVSLSSLSFGEIKPSNFADQFYAPPVQARIFIENQNNGEQLRLPAHNTVNELKSGFNSVLIWNIAKTFHQSVIAPKTEFIAVGSTITNRMKFCFSGDDNPEDSAFRPFVHSILFSKRSTAIISGRSFLLLDLCTDSNKQGNHPLC